MQWLLFLLHYSRSGAGAPLLAALDQVQWLLTLLPWIRCRRPSCCTRPGAGAPLLAALDQVQVPLLLHYTRCRCLFLSLLQQPTRVMFAYPSLPVLPPFSLDSPFLAPFLFKPLHSTSPTYHPLFTFFISLCFLFTYPLYSCIHLRSTSTISR